GGKTETQRTWENTGESFYLCVFIRVSWGPSTRGHSCPGPLLRVAEEAHAAARQECLALWQKAQVAPSVIGFNVSGALADALRVTLGGHAVSAADVKVWEGGGAGGERLVSLEVLLPGAPASWDAAAAGEACAAAVREQLQARRVSEVKSKMAEREQELRRRKGGGATTAGGEGGDANEEEWRAFRDRLRSRRAEPSAQLLGCEDVGFAPGRGRRVLACRLALDVASAWDLGCLAYPQFFVEKSRAEQEADERWFEWCLRGTACFIVTLVALWFAALSKGLMAHHRRAVSPQPA
ncbi:unnamed protein product, partial [Prorocentrum cordatum]